MKLKEDIRLEPAACGGPIPSLDKTFSGLLEDIFPYRSPAQQFRSRMALSLLKLVNIPVQKKLEKMHAEGSCDWFAESIERTYLECRSSLAFFNAYTVYLALDNQRDWFDRAAIVLHCIQQLVVTDPAIATSLRTYRVPQPVCDNLMVPPVSGYGVILFSSQMLVLSHGSSLSADKLQQWSLAARGCVTHELDKFSIGEASALSREDWYKILETGNNNPEFIEAVNLLRSADFIFCMDAESSSQVFSLPNRFFDKAIQIVVNPESTYLVFEHAAIDGQRAVAISETIAAKYYEHAYAKKDFITFADSANTKLWTSRTIGMPASMVIGHRRAIGQISEQFLRRRQSFPELNEQFFDNLARVFDKTVSADNIIQQAMALTFFRLTSRIPSVYEPVSLMHLKPRRLDFISPLSRASVEFMQALEAGDISTARKKLLEAISHHRAKIRQAKMGEGALAHIMALASAEFPDNKQQCVRIQGRRRRLLSRVSNTIRFLAHRDMMVSNGGTSPYLESFSTIVHQPDMLGIGYIIGARGLSIDVQLHGIYKDMFQPGILTHQFIQSIYDVAHTLVPVLDISLIPNTSAGYLAKALEKKQDADPGRANSWFERVHKPVHHSPVSRHTKKETSV